MKDSTFLKWTKYILHVVMIAGVVIAAARYLNGQEVLDALQRFNYNYAPFVLALTASFLALKAWRFIYLMRPVSDLASNIIFRGYVAGQAATLVPGGVAARAGLMKQAGVPMSKSAAPVAYSSILDQVFFVVCLFVSALFFPAARSAALIFLVITVCLVLLFVIPVTRSWLAKAATWLAKKFNAETKGRSLLESMRKVSTPRVLTITVAMTIVAFALRIIALGLIFQGLGITVSYPKLFLVFVLPTMLGRLSGLPAGVGITEAGMVGLITNLTEVDSDTATATVALFRIATIVFQAAIGAVVYYFFWHGEKENPNGQGTNGKGTGVESTGGNRDTRKRGNRSNPTSSQASHSTEAARGEGVGH